jgi:hypothetical protein
VPLIFSCFIARKTVVLIPSAAFVTSDGTIVHGCRVPAVRTFRTLCGGRSAIGFVELLLIPNGPPSSILRLG